MSRGGAPARTSPLPLSASRTSLQWALFGTGACTGDDRTQGKQFVTNKQRGGQTGDNWNRGAMGKRVGVERLYEGEKYIDPHKGDATMAKKEVREGARTRPQAPSERSCWLE